MKKFLLVDDHLVVRSGMKGLLSGLCKPSEIHEAGDGDSAIENLESNNYDLIVMDIKMIRTNTLELMKFINAKYPNAKVLIFSMSAENIYAKRFLKAGAWGFISKEATLEEIMRAINLILNGSRYISESLARILAEEFLPEEISEPF